MIDYFGSVYINGGLLACCGNLHIHPSAFQGLGRGGKAFGIPALDTGIASVSVVAVHRVPGMRQIHLIPVRWHTGRQTGVLRSKQPVLVQTD